MPAGSFSATQDEPLQTGSPNDRVIQDLWGDYVLARKFDKTTDFIQKNKEEAKSFNPFRYIFSKHDKTGRFGAKTAPEANDSISALGAGGLPKGYYFDPFSLEVYEDPDATDNDEEQFDDIRLLAQFDNPRHQKILGLKSDFEKRVEVQTALSRENDFEKDRVGFDARMAMAQAIHDDIHSQEIQDELRLRANGQQSSKEQIESRNAKITKEVLAKVKARYNAGKTFVPDEPAKELMPDSFTLQIMVDDAPQRYYQDWAQFQAEKTQGVLGRIKGFFRKMFGQGGPDRNALFKEFTESHPEYRRIVQEGMTEAAKKPGTAYDPDKDPAMQKFKNQIAGIKDQRSSFGHSIVRMKAKKYGVPVSVYSFMFGSTASPGMAGVITGKVSNPARPKAAVEKGSYDISYSAYLNAAAKIRGTVGAMRTYSIMGYNCSSFASEVAIAAGIPLRDEDTSSNTITFRHRSQKVDSPYNLAMLQQDRRTAKENTPEYQAKKALEDSRYQQLSAAYLPRMMQSRAVTDVLSLKLLPQQEIDDILREVITDIAQRAVKVELDNPVDGLTGDELDAAQDRRAKARALRFGADTPGEDALLSAFSSSEFEIAEMLIGSLRHTDPKVLSARLWGKSLLMKNSTYMDKLKQMASVKAALGDMPQQEADDKLSLLVDKIRLKQHELHEALRGAVYARGGNSLTMLTQLNQILSAGPYELEMLGEKLFDSEQKLTAFLNAAHIPIIEPKPEQEPAASAAPSVPAAAPAAEASSS